MADKENKKRQQQSKSKQKKERKKQKKKEECKENEHSTRKTKKKNTPNKAAGTTTYRQKQKKQAQRPQENGSKLQKTQQKCNLLKRNDICNSKKNARNYNTHQKSQETKKLYIYIISPLKSRFLFGKYTFNLGQNCSKVELFKKFLLMFSRGRLLG